MVSPGIHHYFLETTGGRAQPKRHACVVEDPSMSDDGSEVATAGVWGNLVVTLAKIQLAEHCGAMEQGGELLSGE